MTFSLAGRCARTGMLGAVVTTSSIAVGSRCQSAASGVGAALTQHLTDPRLGPMMLDLLRSGHSAQEAIDAAVAVTPRSDLRQLGVIDKNGRVASFGGASMLPESAEIHGQDCLALANIVRSRAVPVAMVEAFEADPSAPLATRLIAALKAGEDAGGEVRPLVSAAVVVAHEQAFPYVDLRVDRDEDPIAALSRLWQDYAPTADLYVQRVLDPGTAFANRPRQPA